MEGLGKLEKKNPMTTSRSVTDQGACEHILTAIKIRERNQASVDA
jgi:hypothetical protein